MIRQFQYLVLVILLGWPPVQRADEAQFSIGGASVWLVEATNEVAVLFQSMRFSRTARVWNVEVVLTNITTKTIQGPFVVLIDGFSGTPGPLLADGFDAHQKPFYNLSGTVPSGVLPAGERSAQRTLTLAYSSGAVPHLTARVYASSSSSFEALGLTRTLNETGQPLLDAVVLESGPRGQRTNRTDSITGVVTLGQGPGAHRWIFSSANYLPVWRSQTLLSGEVAVLPNPRLTRRDTNGVAATPQAAGSIASRDGSIQASYASGTFAQSARITLTPLTSQTLPALLLLGWSPLQAFWLELADAKTQLPLELSSPMSVLLKPWGPIAANESAALVQWNQNSLSWDVLELVSGKGTNAVTVHLPGNGAFALVVGDADGLNLSVAQVGKPLPVRALSLTSYTGLAASGTVEPAVSLASRAAELVTAKATVTITSAVGRLPSGLPLRCEVREIYRLRDGTRRFSPQYETFLVGYQRPGGQQPATLQAQFSLRPLRLFGAEELDEATMTVDVMAPTAFAGGVLGVQQSSVTVGDVQILAGPGDLASSQAVQVRLLPSETFSELVGGGVSAVGAFELTVSGVAPGRKLGLQWSGTPSNSVFVLARVLSENGFYGLQPIERLASDSYGNLSSLELSSGERLPGLNSSGQYVLTQVTGPQGLVIGAVRNAAGQLAGGLPVRITGQPWLTLSAADGSYRLVTPTGRVEVATTDPTTGDSGVASLTITDPKKAAQADVSAAPSGPRVTKVTPAAGAVNVARVTSVVVEFSKPINPGSLGADGIKLMDTNNQPIAASLTLNLANTVATLLPGSQLAPLARHTIRISTNLTDLANRRLEGANAFFFTTASDALSRTSAQVTSYEPGTNGMARMVGSPGIAETEAPVILVNESSGRTATVLSKVDGSFDNFIEANAEDYLTAVIVNKNGTRNTISVSRQLFRDGSVGLFNGGGILEAQSDGAPVQVMVEPGAIEGKTKFKLDIVPMTRMLSLLKGVSPQDGQVLGGFTLQEDGDEPQNELGIAFPINSAALGLPPGQLPKDQGYALTIPREFDGVMTYQIVNQMHFENGRLVTHSPPFPGVQIRGLTRGVLNSQRHDNFQESVSTTLSQTLSSFGCTFSPVMLVSGGTVVLHGEVVSQRVFANGLVIPGSEKLVPGAVVSITTDNAVLDKRGHLEPGQFTAITDDKGEFALLVPQQTAQGSGSVLQATHPRFPNQVALATLTRAGGTEIGTAGFRLRFTMTDPTSFQTADILPPKITISHLPLDPPPKTGIFMKVSAIDDRDVQSLTLRILSSAPLANSPGPLTFTGPVEISSTNLGGTGLEKTFLVSSSQRSRVTFQAQTADSAGNLSVANYDLIVAGDRPAPSSIGDTNGPRVVFCWPPNGATGVKPQDLIILRFSKDIDATNVSSAALGSWLSFSSGHTPVSAALSPDRREVTLHYNGPVGGSVSLTVNGQLTDLGGHGLDMDPGAPGNQSFSVAFKQEAQTAVNLPGVSSGAGIMLKGAYAYLLDRQPGRGWLKVLSISDPDHPVEVGSLALPDYPRAMELISRWRYKQRPSDAPLTNDLIAVAGGLVSAPDSEGSTPNGQYLWIIDVGDPAQPRRLAGSILTYEISTVNKLKWFAPHLAYLESGADNSAVGLINLQSYLVGINATDAEVAQFPPDGFDGVDKDGDGDYCGPNDQLPIPAGRSAGLFGLEYTFPSPESQYIMDFDVDASKALLGVVLRPQGYSSSNNGSYVTLYSGTRFLDPATAAYPLPPNKIPRRVAIMPGVLMEAEGSLAQAKLRDLALISVEGSPSELHVIDISDPQSPYALPTIQIKSKLGSQTYDFGNIQSIQRRADGLVALAAVNDVLLLDLRKLQISALTNVDISPVIVGFIGGAGSGGRVFASETAGLNLVNLGGKHSLIRTPPFLDIVSFVTNTPFSATNLLSLADREKHNLWTKRTSSDLLLKARVRFSGNQAAAPLPLLHYYLQVDAPGGAGQTLDIVMESLNTAGAPLPNPPTNGVPVRLASMNTLGTLNDTNASVFPRTIQCRRLSDDLRSEFYNIYLSDPFLLSGQSISNAQLTSLLAVEPSGLAMVKPDKFLWASLDPQMSNNAVVGAYASRVANQRLVPGSSVRKSVEKPHLPLVLVPGVAGSLLGAGGNADDDWLTLCRSVQALDLNGGSSNVFATGVLRAVLILIKFYGPVIDDLVGTGGYVLYDDHRKAEQRTLIGADYQGQQANGPNLFIYPYDWRRDNWQSATGLAEFVQVALKFNPDAEAVNIIAHSMGGLVSRRFIIDQTNNIVNKFITVDTPFLGAPKFINVMQTGDFAPIAWVETELMRRLVQFFPGPHELAPSKYYFEAAGVAGNPMLEYGWDVNRDGNSYGGALSYSQYKDVFDRVLSPYSRPIAINEAFNSYVSPSGNHQTVWTNDTTGVQNIHIVGVQQAIQTIGAVRHTDRMRALKDCNNLVIDLAESYLNATQSLAAHPTNDYSRENIFHPINHEVELTYVRGDGTVPEISQTRKATNGVSMDDPKAKTWTFYGSTPDTDKMADHNGILNNRSTFQAIYDFLDDVEPVQTAAPARGDVTMYSVRLTDVDPLTLITYDGAGIASAAPLPSQSCYYTVLFHKGKYVPTGQGCFEVLFPGGQTSTVEFQPPARPFNIVLLKHVNGVIEERTVYKGMKAPANFSFLVRINASGSIEVGLGHGMNAILPLGTSVTLTNSAARNIIPPTVTQSSSASDWFFTATDNYGQRAHVYLVHDTNGDGDLGDEVHELLPDNKVAMDRITDDKFYVRAEDQALNLSTPKRIQRSIPPPVLACPSFNYPALGAGLASQSKLLESIFQGVQPVSLYTSLASAGIPIFEGYELAMLSEYTMLTNGMMLRVVHMTDGKPVFRNKLRQQLIQTGQAASRAALGLIIGSPASLTNLSRILLIDPAQFGQYGSFEKFIAARARVTTQIFAAEEFDLLDKAANAATCDPATLDSLMTDDCMANTYLADALKFIRRVQNRLQSDYNNAMQLLDTPGQPLYDHAQFNRRTAALLELAVGNSASHIDGLNIVKQFVGLDMVVRVFNRGSNTLDNVKIDLVLDRQTNPAYQALTITNSMTPDQVVYFKGDSSTIPAKEFSLVEPVTVRGTTVRTAYLIVDPDGEITETDKNDNWCGFQYYILDLNNPCPASVGALPAIPPPSSNLLRFEPVCQ